MRSIASRSRESIPQIAAVRLQSGMPGSWIIPSECRAFSLTYNAVAPPLPKLPAKRALVYEIKNGSPFPAANSPVPEPGRRSCPLANLRELGSTQVDARRRHVLLKVSDRRSSGDWQHRRGFRKQPRDRYLHDARLMHACERIEFLAA